jgi:hypothetical protein
MRKALSQHEIATRETTAIDREAGLVRLTTQRRWGERRAGAFTLLLNFLLLSIAPIDRNDNVAHYISQQQSLRKWQ